MRPQDIAAAATANFRAHATFPSRGIPDATVRESEALTWVDSALDTDTFNIVLGSRLAPKKVAGSLREIADHFTGVGRPFSWWVAPGDEPEDLEERLETGGLVAEEYELAMSVDLRAARLEGAPGVAGLRIDRARTTERLFDFARINAENWSPPDPNVEMCYARNRAALLAAGSPQAFYVASLEGKAVAAVEITTAGAVAGVYNLSTRMAYRGRGIGAAILSDALREARERGCDTAVLQAAPLAAGLYRRLGFVEFGRIRELKPRRSV